MKCSSYTVSWLMTNEYCFYAHTKNYTHAILTPTQTPLPPRHTHTHTHTESGEKIVASDVSSTFSIGFNWRQYIHWHHDFFWDFTNFSPAILLIDRWSFHRTVSKSKAAFIRFSSDLNTGLAFASEGNQNCLSTVKWGPCVWNDVSSFL